MKPTDFYAKYKPFDNIFEKDYLQLLAYMYRFDSKKGFYVYPYRSSETRSHIETFDLLQGVSGNTSRRKLENNISVIKLGTKFPAHADTFRKFESEIKKSELMFKNHILQTDN